MRKDSEFGFRPRKHEPGFAWGSVMIDDALYVGLTEQLRVCHSHPMNEQIGAGPIGDDILVVAGIPRDDGHAILIFNPITVGRLYRGAMIDRKRDDPQSMSLIDDTVLGELFGCDSRVVPQ